jgi:hypothetical protein
MSLGPSEAPAIENALSSCGVGSIGSVPPDREVTEVPLLLPAWEAALLEEAARRRGLTVGRMLRRLVRDLLRADFDKHPSRPG